jgi:hypothetical protein
MTRRLVAVLVPAPGADGFPDEALRAAMVEDVYETVAALELVEPVLVVDAHDPARDLLESLVWPGTTVLHLPPPSGSASRTWQTLDGLAAAGADQVTVVAGDAPDLPGLLVGKLHRALGSADVAVLPDSAGGLVALSTHVPLPASRQGQPPSTSTTTTQWLRCGKRRHVVLRCRSDRGGTAYAPLTTSPGSTPARMAGRSPASCSACAGSEPARAAQRQVENAQQLSGRALVKLSVSNAQCR